MIPYGRQEITDRDIEAIVKVLRSDFVTQGPKVPEFEQALNQYCGSDYAVAVNSATSALHIACLALGLGRGDWLWTSPNTFVASANCALYCGAKVDFVDIDPQTYNLSVEQLTRKLQWAKKNNCLPKIVIPVHYAGHPCDMEPIYALSEEYHFQIIEDASHAIGSSYKTHMTGSCQYSHITVFSFHPVKIITTGEGGAALTNDESLARKMRQLRSHGITNEKSLFEERSDFEIWNYQQVDLGWNYRMSDISASLGTSQLSRLTNYVDARIEIAETYNNELKGLPLQLPTIQPDVKSSLHLYPVRVNNIDNPKTQLTVYEGLRQHGIASNLHYIPVHRQPFYERMGFSSGDFPIAEQFHLQAISLPIFPGLSKKEQERVIEVLGNLV